MRLYIADQMVLPALGSVRLSRTRSEAAATLTATILTAPADNYFQKLRIAVGDPVRLTDDDGTERFLGGIQEVQRTQEQVTLTAFDRGVYLTRNEICGVFTGSAADIAAQVAAKLGIPLGEVNAGSGRKTIVSRAGQSAFSILRQAAGRDCLIGVSDGKLTVTRPYNVYLLRPETLLNASSLASIRGMVNRCVVVGRNGGVLAAAQNDAEIALYGQFQSVAGRDGDAASQAAEGLTGCVITAEVVVTGEAAYSCGCAVELHRPDWGIDGVYAVTASEHRWEGGVYTTTLDLEWIRA